MFLLKRTALILGCLIALPAFGQNAQTILPNTFGGWTATSRQALQPGTQPAANPPGVDQAHAALSAREYGFKSGEIAYYANSAPSIAGQPAETLTATLYQMKDPSGGYGEYSYLRKSDMNRADFSDHSSANPGEALVLLGNLVLDVTGTNTQRDAADLKALVSAVTSKAQDGLLPTLPDHLPVDNRVDKSDHYILGPSTLDQFFPGDLGYSLGFSYGTEAETAHFQQNGRDVTMLIADFPTPQIAQSQLDSLSKKFNINGSLPSATSPTLFADRSQTMLSIVAGASSRDEASKLLDQVRAGQVLTWNEPTFQFKEPSISVMIVGAFVGTGVICLYTMVGALAFGGFRLAVKRLFPNMLFDRSQQMDILQMGLVSKPIKSEDFYTFDGTRIDTSGLDKNLPDRTALRLFK
jgi:hypothetical protein